MGIFQTIGGAATSGRGLTARQVAAALSTTVAAQLKCHQERLKLRVNQHGDKESEHLEGTPTIEEIKSEDYTEERTLRINVADATGEAEVVVYEYAPNVFRLLRQLSGVDESVFAEEWILPEERLALELGEGRSMAMFLKSKSMEFMCKTIALVEVETLLKILREYTQHLACHRNSLLMRFLMLLRVECGKNVGYILCFGDVFSACQVLNEKWDLKGRIPKPGKYLHFPKFIQRPHEPVPYVIDTPRETIEVPNFLDKEPKETVVVAARDKYKLATRGDKSLTRLFWLERSQRERLLETILNDYNFLEEVGLMDYSLLIGVAYNDNKLTRSGKHIKSMKMTYEMGVNNEAVEIRPPGARTSIHLLNDGLKINDDFTSGISSLYNQEIYYIGIIDMLTFYTAKKKTANFCKSFLWKSETLSTIPPKPYRDRITKYTRIIFPAVDMDVSSNETTADSLHHR